MTQLEKVMVTGNYAQRSIVTYSRELTFFALYFPDVDPMDWTEQDVIDYMTYLKTVLQASYSKHKMFAQSVAFFFRHVLKRPFDTPSKLYPRREFKLPSVLSQGEVKKLIESCTTIKQRCIVELFYGTGLRLEELQYLKMTDIEAANNRIRVTKGKGKRERFTILPQKCLINLRKYYRAQKVQPKVYLFEGRTPGKPMHARAIQYTVRQAYKHAGLYHKERKTHALRHSFATHMLDNGCDIFTIKELLGHSKIETTMVYLHLQTSKRNSLVSPLDAMYQPENQIALVDKNANLLE